jgi:transcriptional regulator with XRE-family HTH domain
VESHDWPESLIRALCEVLKEQRVALGLSIYALSQTSGVSQQAIGYYEKLLRRPTVESLARISKAMNLKLSELVALAEARSQSPLPKQP